MIDTIKKNLYISVVMLGRQIIFPLIVTVFFASCETPVEPERETDPITDITFSYLQEEEKIFASVKLKDPFNGISILFVRLIWYSTHGLNYDAPDSIYLNDNGDFGDILKSDNIYSRKLRNQDLVNTLTYGDTGTVYLSMIAMYYDNTSYSLVDSFSLGNIIPRIDWIQAPDTLLLPTTGIETDTIRVKVTDADGLEDIKWVGFTSQKPNGTYANRGNPIYLYDDGGEVILYEPYNLTSGDSAKGDGIYSYVLILDTSAATGSYIWTFRAQDLSNAYSNTITHTLILQ